MFTIKAQKDVPTVVSEMSDAVGIKNDTVSFDYKIVDSFVGAVTSVTDHSAELLREFSLSEKTGEELDDYLESQGISRYSGSSTKIYRFALIFNGEGYFYIKSDSLFNYGGNTYKVIYPVKIESGSTETILAFKEDVASEIETPVFTHNASVEFNLDDVEAVNKEDLSSVPSVTIQRYLSLGSVSLDPGETESDVEYLERGKRLAQENGYSNSVKIENALYSDSRIKNIISKKAYGTHKYYIIPYDVTQLDAILESAQEVVQYFKCSDIRVKKPSLVKFSVNGLLSQIPYNDLSTVASIESATKTYIQRVADTFKFSRPEYISTISGIISVSYPDLDFNGNAIDIVYKLYSPNDYTNPIITGSVGSGTEPFGDTSAFALAYIS